jgi:hypothetical protein
MTQKKLPAEEVQQLLDWLAKAESATSETMFRDNAITDYQFYAGSQDSTLVLEKLAELNRPNTTLNQIRPKVDMIVGSAARARHEFTVVPVGAEDAPMCEFVQKVLDHYVGKLQLLDKETSAFEHTVKAGRALLYFYIDKSNPFEPKVVPTVLRGTEFFIDPNSVQYDLSDAEYIIVENWTRKDLIKTYWNVDPEAFSAAMVGYQGKLAYYNEITDLYRLTEIWYKKFTPVNYFQNPLTGKVEYLHDAELKAFKKQLEEGIQLPNGQVLLAPNFFSVRSVKEEVHYAILLGDQVLEHGISPYAMNKENPWFPGILFAGYKDEDNNCWFSVIRQLRDPQKMYNTMHRQLQHLIQTLPKGILATEAGAILNIEEYQQRSSDPAFYLEIAPGKFQNWKFEKQPTISPIYNVVIEQMSRDIKNTSGAEDPLLGIQTTSRESGESVKMRQEGGLSVLYILFDNLRKSKLQVRRVLLSMIQQYVTMPTAQRIVGPAGDELLYINTQLNPQLEGFNDLSFGMYDVEFVQSVESPSGRAAVASSLMEYSHNNPGAIPPDIILDYLDVPYSVKQRVLQAWQEQIAFDRKMQEAEMKIKLLAASSRQLPTKGSEKKED